MLRRQPLPVVSFDEPSLALSVKSGRYLALFETHGR
jgi:hypothetical protein